MRSTFTYLIFRNIKQTRRSLNIGVITSDSEHYENPSK